MGYRITIPTNSRSIKSAPMPSMNDWMDDWPEKPPEVALSEGCR